MSRELKERKCTVAWSYYTVDAKRLAQLSPYIHNVTEQNIKGLVIKNIKRPFFQSVKLISLMTAQKLIAWIIKVIVCIKKNGQFNVRWHIIFF